jgi:hypothetical protein
MKSRRMRWVRHVAHMGRIGMHIGFWCESQGKIDHYEDLDVGGRKRLSNLRERGWDSIDWIDQA